MTRIEFKWAIIEPARGTYDWTEPDRLITFLNRHNIEPMLMLYCAPKWAMRGTPEDENLFISRGEQNLHTVVWPRRAFLGDFERFCETASRRYRGKATLFEFWNEPDGMAGPIVLHDKTGRAVDVRYGGDAAEYVHWLEAMYRATKRGNPDAQIAAGSLCVHDLKFIEAMYAAGARNVCDAVSLHPYAGDGVNIGWIQQVRGVMTRYGDWCKPVWLSEFGWTHGPQYDEATGSFPRSADNVADLIVRTFPTIIELPYVTHSFFFTLNDWTTRQGGIDPVGIHSFGLLDLGFHRRPGFEAFRHVVANTPDTPRRGETPIPTIAPPAGPTDVQPDRSFVARMTCFNPTANDRSERVNLTITAPELLGKTINTSIELPRPPAGPLTWHAFVPNHIEPGTWPLTATLDGAPPCQFLVTTPAPARRRQSPPSIDADLTDWPDGLGILRDQMTTGFAWDAEHLYFAARIVDNKHQQPHHDRNLWKGDCVQLAVDPERDAVRGSRYDDNDSEFALALCDQGPILWRYACPLDSYVGELPRRYVAARHLGNETCYEAAIPWTEIAVENPHAGQVIGIAVAGCDWTGEDRTVYRFGDGVIGGKEPYRFASIRLDKEK